MNEWERWFEDHKPDPALPKQIREMHRMYGKGPAGAKCKTCRHIYSKNFGTAGKYFKCDLNRDTNGPGTDWRLKWPACGKHEERQEQT